MRFLLEAKNLVFVRNKQVEKILVGAGFNILDFRRSLFLNFFFVFLNYSKNRWEIQEMTSSWYRLGEKIF